MEDSKDDKKDDKVINFHQMELDDRILKVKWTNIQNYYFFNQEKINKISGNSEAWMDHTDNDSRERDTTDT